MCNSYIYVYYQSENKYEKIVVHYNDVCGKIYHPPTLMQNNVNPVSNILSDIKY